MSINEPNTNVPYTRANKEQPIQSFSYDNLNNEIILRHNVRALTAELADAQAHEVPNVIIENPRLRKAIGFSLDLALLGLVTIMAIDAAAPAMDISAFTVPALAGIGTLRAGFGFVQNKNTPS